MKSPLVMLVAMSVRAMSPLLVRVTVCAEEVVVATVFGKLSAVGESMSVAALVPTPVRDAV